MKNLFLSLAVIATLTVVSCKKTEEAAVEAPVEAVEAPVEAPATAETVANCQSDVDAAIKGKTVQFETGTATLSPASLSLIEALAKSIADCAGTKVEVAGHTDITGSDVANMALSKARAESVVAALVAKAVPADRLVPVGYGETKPLDPAATPAANAVNRRIEFAVATAG